jgi:hypothetical protein
MLDKNALAMDNLMFPLTMKALMIDDHSNSINPEI